MKIFSKLVVSSQKLVAYKGFTLVELLIVIAVIGILATVLIVAVFIIYQQIQFIQNADAGYNKNNVLRLSAEGNLSTKQDAFIAALKKIPGVTNASATNHRMVGHNFATDGLDWPGKPTDDNTYFEGFETDYDFVETMGMHIKDGLITCRQLPDQLCQFLCI